MTGDGAFAGVPSAVPRPVADLEPLPAWLRAGVPTGRRLDFPAGTALPDGRLDLAAAGRIGTALTAVPHRLGHLVLAAAVPPPAVAQDVAAVRSVHRTPPPY